MTREIGLSKVHQVQHGSGNGSEDVAPNLSMDGKLSSSVIRVFSIAEIARKVAENVQNAAFNRGRANLASLAMSCRSVSDVALDVLWRNLDSLLPLLRVLPIEERDLDSDEELKVILTRYPTEFEWNRWQFYARRVRDIGFDESFELDNSVVTCLQLGRTTGELIPNLRSLVIATDTLVYLPFLSVSIRKLHVTEHRPLQAELVVRAALRESLNTQDMTLETPLDATILHLIAGFFAMRTLHLVDEFERPAPLPLSSFNDLAALPYLTKLHVRLSQVYDNQVLIGTIHPGGFKALQTLLISATLNQASTLIRLLATPSLQTVNIRSSLYARAESSVPFEQLFRPLYDCSQIIDFAIECNGFRVKLTDENLEELARAWPRLQALHIGFSLHRPIILSELPTIRSLAFFALHNPQLRSLFLTVRGEPIPAIEDFPSTQHCLQKLKLNTKGFRDEKLVARVVDGLFPALDEVVVTKSAWMKERPAIPHVPAFDSSLPGLIQLVQAVRQDERRRRCHAGLPL